MTIPIQKKLFSEVLDLIAERGRCPRPTNAEMAAKTGVSRITVWYYVEGRRSVPFWWMMRLVNEYYPHLRPGAVAKIGKRLLDLYGNEGTLRDGGKGKKKARRGKKPGYEPTSGSQGTLSK